MARTEDLSTFAPNSATYIVQTANSGLSAEQALGALATGILRNTTTTGVLSVVTDGAGYLKSDGAGNYSFDTPSGFSWGASITGISTPGVLLTAGNVQANNGTVLSVVFQDTQDGAQNWSGIKIDLGAANFNGIYGLSIAQSKSTNTATSYGIYWNETINTGSSGTKYGIYQAGLNLTAGGTGHGFYQYKLAGNGGTAYGIYQDRFVDNGGTAYGIYQNEYEASSGTAYGWYVANIGRATVGNGSKYFSLNNAQSGNLEARTNDASEMLFSRTNTATTGTKADNFNLMYLRRTSVQNGAGGTLTAAGNVLKLENVSTQTDGTLTDTTAILTCLQGALTSTNFKKTLVLNTVTIWTSDGTSPNGALSGTAGDLCFGADSGKSYYCTGTTNWTAL